MGIISPILYLEPVKLGGTLDGFRVFLAIWGPLNYVGGIEAL